MLVPKRKDKPKMTHQSTQTNLNETLTSQLSEVILNPTKLKTNSIATGSSTETLSDSLVCQFGSPHHKQRKT